MNSDQLADLHRYLDDLNAASPGVGLRPLDGTNLQLVFSGEDEVEVTLFFSAERGWLVASVDS